MKLVMLDALTLGDFDSKPFEQLGDFIKYKTTTQQQVIERCIDADIVLTNKVVLDSNILSQLKNLKLICVMATGTNNIDVAYAEANNIVVKNAVGYSTNAVAQHTLMLALSLLGRLNYYTRYVKNGEWVNSDIFCHLKHDLQDLNGKEWGIIGYGSIGKQVSKLASAFGANVSYYSTSGKNIKNDIPHKTLDDLLKTSNIISIHAPLNNATWNLIGAKQLEQLQSGAILLNLGRGGIVNEGDIAKILKKKDIFFGTDVLEKEPMIPNHPLLDSNISSKVLITPHVAWAYKDARQRLISIILDNIESFINKR